MAKAKLEDLPDEVRQLVEPALANTPETLDAIGVALARRRDDAKTARAQSGIEEVWKDAEEAYVGIDDANRTEFQSAKWAKPMAITGPVETGRAPKNADYKSTVFVRLSARYVDAGAAKLTEILLPPDDKPFSFSEMPVPDLIKAKEDMSQVVHDGLGAAQPVPLTRPANPGEAAAASPPAAPAAPAGAAMPGAPAPGATPAAPPAPAPGGNPAAAAQPQPPAPGAPRVPLTVSDLAKEAIEIARKKAKAAEERVYGWMVGCQHVGEVRKVIKDQARIGVGVLNAPVPKVKRGIALLKGDAGGAVEIKVVEKIVPSSRWCDPWNIFPDPACGENIHDGDFIFERDYMSERQVRELKRLPGYVQGQIDRVLLQGPLKGSKDEDTTQNPHRDKQKDRYEIWYYYGALKREEFACVCAAAKTPFENLPPDQSEIYVLATLINDCVVRAVVNPLDSGSFPYHSVPWQRRAGHWAGIGVAEQLKTPQRMINAATRAMMNNAGKSAGSQIVVDREAIQPADGVWVWTPDKLWYKKPGSMVDDVNKAFATFELPNQTEELMKIVEYALQLAEESTSIPLVTQGQSGETQPDTLGATNIQNNNANQLLRDIGYAFDDYITEPVVRQYYEWLLLDPDVPDDEKGDFQINAHGSVALVERAIQDQSIAQMANVVKDPAYGLNPKKWAELFLKSKRLDPEEVQYTEEEQARIDANPVQDPRVTAATITSNTNLKLGVMKQQTDMQSLASEDRVNQAAAELEGGRLQSEDRRTLTNATVDLHNIAQRDEADKRAHERALLDYANRHQMKLHEVRADLVKHFTKQEPTPQQQVPPPPGLGRGSRQRGGRREAVQ